MSSALAVPPSPRETIISSFSLTLRKFLNDRKVTFNEARQKGMPAYGMEEQ